MLRMLLEHLEDCYVLLMDEDLEETEKIKYINKKKFVKHLEELNTYIENNSHLIPNYGEKYRYGETISSSFVESTVNEVVTKRMVKKQQNAMVANRRTLFTSSENCNTQWRFRKIF